MAPTIPRRTFLRGAGRVALALPALELMAPTARAGQNAIPRRFVMSFAGTSIGRGNHPEIVTPSDTGPTYDPGPGLSPLIDEGVLDDVTVLSGLTIPWGPSNAVPAGGRTVSFHYNTTVPQIAGTKSLQPQDGPSAPTADRLVADAIGGDTLFDVLTYRVQVTAYWSGNGSGGNIGRLSWRDDGMGGVQAVDPIVSPSAAYDDLFLNFVPEDPEQAAALAKARARTLSVIDLVKDNTAALLPRLGARDRIRIEQHFDEIRALETKLQAEPPPTTGACEQLPAFPPDPDPGGASFDADGDYQPNGGYSGENERADRLSDLIAMAFACDLSRSASYMLTMWKCYMNALPVVGRSGDIHGLTHGSYGSPEGAADGVAWHVRHFGRLIKKLADLPEVDGSSILDHTAAVLLFEGGHGYDPATGNDPSAHSTENMLALVAGRAGGLSPKGHQPLPGEHPARAVTSCMEAVGAQAELGDISGTLDVLFG